MKKNNYFLLPKILIYHSKIGKFFYLYRLKKKKKKKAL